MRLGITVPVFVTNWNLRDFLNKTTESIRTSHEYVFLPVLNRLDPQFRPYPWQFVQYPNELYELEGRQPQCVAKAWNDGIQKALELGCDYVLVLNEDIVLKSNAIDNLVAFAEAHQEGVLWSMAPSGDLFGLEDQPDNPADFHEHPCFSAFMVDRRWPQAFGKFDENFQLGYCEDSDAHARLALAHQRAYITAGAWFFHFGSRTLAADENLREENHSLQGANGKYFVEKWGSGIVNEVDQMRQVYFPHPYNETDKPLKYWRGGEFDAHE